MWNFGSDETMLGEYGQYRVTIIRCSTPSSIQYRYFDEPKDEGILNPRWPLPAYKGLIGDVLPSFLCFSEFPFPEPPTTPDQPFPSLIETYAYLRTFAEPYLKDGKIKLNREVVRVLEREQGKTGWSVTYKDWNSDGREVEEV